MLIESSTIVFKYICLSSSKGGRLLKQELFIPLKGYDDNKVFKEQYGLLTFGLSVQDHKHRTNLYC